MSRKDLVEIIKKNPGCRAEIDNDMWTLYKKFPENWDEMSWEEQDEWYESEGELVSSCEDIVVRGSGYGSGNCYGGDILQALAEIVGVEVESV